MKVIGQARSPYIGLGKSTLFHAAADDMELIHRFGFNFRRNASEKSSSYRGRFRSTALCGLMLDGHTSVVAMLRAMRGG
jgi:hypothetical protein